VGLESAVYLRCRVMPASVNVSGYSATLRFNCSLQYLAQCPETAPGDLPPATAFNTLRACTA
jgi:hypothetical protein